MPRSISKSRFLSGVQCHKKLWLETHQPELGEEPDDALQAIFDTGHRVGALARTRYPGGVLVEEDHRHSAQALSTTKVLLGRPDVPAIFEGAFFGSSVFARADILVRVGERQWQMIEVKSAGKAKDVHDLDLAIQLFAARAAGIDVVACGLLLVNTAYVFKRGTYDVSGLFRYEDRTKAAEELLTDIEPILAGQLAVLEQPAAPSIPPSPHCMAPYSCQFWNHCTSRMPEDWVFYLPRMQEAQYQRLADTGLLGISQVPPATDLLTPTQERVREAVTSGRTWTSPSLAERLAGLGAPPYNYLDFETVNPTLPIYEGTRPFEVVPFMFSCLTVDRNGAQLERHYFHDGTDDPRPSVAQALLESVPNGGPIVTYSSYDKRVINSLADNLPEYADGLMALSGRCVDLLRVVAAAYCHPATFGDNSLKTVAPALVPEIYSGLAVTDGTEAASAYLRFVSGDGVPDEWPELREQIVEYCKRDTLATATVHKALIDVV